MIEGIHVLNILKKHFNRLYQKPTIIQKKVYQPLLAGKNVVGLSPTGSGKTVAFLLPLLSRISDQKSTQLLIFEPSQELAIQISHVAREWGNLFHFKTQSLTGGANLRRQKDKLKRHPQIVVGTPGRIQALVSSRKLKLGHLKSVVIDEADNLLSGGTLSVIRSVLNQGPSHVQLSYFSATDTQILHHLKRWFASSAVRVDVRKLDRTRGPVTHGLLRISRRKRKKMLKMLDGIPKFQALVFFDHLKELNQTYSFFHHLHIRSVAKLAGYQGQIPRARAMRGFRNGRVKLLLTTEIAARGLDIPKLPAVINYDLPQTAVSYIHRTGRTGRMGNPGLVINFGDDHDFRDLRHLLNHFNYRFKKIYFYHNRIVDRDQLRQLLKKTRGSYRDRHSKANRKAALKRQNPRRHYHKRSKNKGMRHKWQILDRR